MQAGVGLNPSVGKRGVVLPDQLAAQPWVAGWSGGTPVHVWEGTTVLLMEPAALSTQRLQ